MENEIKELIEELRSVTEELEEHRLELAQLQLELAKSGEKPSRRSRMLLCQHSTKIASWECDREEIISNLLALKIA